MEEHAAHEALHDTTRSPTHLDRRTAPAARRTDPRLPAVLPQRATAQRHIRPHGAPGPLGGARSPRSPPRAHLRTCQCHERGCSRHPRHRGCGGPIRLVLARDRGGRLWRLADACTACAAATTQAAVVPDTFINPTTSSAHAGIYPKRRSPRGPDRQTRVREMLNYLASALPAETGAAARLIALQCALRMNDSAQVRFPLGVLRSLRLGPATDSWRELHQARWLRSTPSASHSNARAEVIHFLDIGLFAQCPARPDRLAAADWALRAACRVRTDCAPLPRLIAMCVTAHTAPEGIYGIAELDRLAHECGLPTTRFTNVLDQLTVAGRIDSWIVHSVSGDLYWTL